MASAAKKPFRQKIFLANIPVALVNPGKNYGPNKYVFRVPLTMTKIELKIYFTKLYNVKVKKVNTMIYDGKLKRNWRGKVYKTSRYKKAIITLEKEASEGPTATIKETASDVRILDAEIVSSSKPKKARKPKEKKESD